MPRSDVRGIPGPYEHWPSGQRGNGVEHPPRRGRARAVDFRIREGVVHGATDVSVVDEQVQRLAVIGHLVGPVGPADDPERVLVDSRTGFGQHRGQDRRPIESALALTAPLTVVATFVVGTLLP